MRYFLIAGEASGDLHGAHLIRAIRQEDSCATFSFMGGDLMAKEAGNIPIIHYRTMAFMGFFPVLLHLADIHKAAMKVQKAIVDFNPDVVIPIDYSGFNFRYILPFVHKKVAKASLFYYIPPKVWAWKKGRVADLKRYCSQVFSIFPFEQDFLKSRCVNAHYVGNPCVDAVGKYWNLWGTAEIKDRIADLPISGQPYVALLPGSRQSEVKSNLPLMLKTLNTYYPTYPCIIAGAPGLDLDFYKPLIQGYNVQVFFDRTYDLLAGADFALVTSGTATLETALIGTPQIVCYRSIGLSLVNWIFSLFPIRYFSLVNLVAQAPVIEELLSAQVTPQQLHQAIERLLVSKEKISEGYSHIRKQLGRHPVARTTAQLITHSIAH